MWAVSALCVVQTARCETAERTFLSAIFFTWSHPVSGRTSTRRHAPLRPRRAVPARHLHDQLLADGVNFQGLV